jgi:phosphoribosylformimino-5-aminoimidazole carboxamide ribotide isomerase
MSHAPAARLLYNLRVYLFPAIDLREGKVVRLLKGDYGRQTTYGDDPVAFAKAFEQAGATWLHVVNLDGARSGVPGHLEEVEAIRRNTGLKIEFGGGVRSEASIRALLGVGVTRVVLGTAALQDWNWFESLARDTDLAERIVLGLDAREGRLAVAGWEQTTDLTAQDVARKVSDWNLAAIVYTDIATDGTLQGPNVEATDAIARATRVPVVASGGVGTLDHLRTLRTLPIQGAIVGRALYDGAFTIEEAIEVLERGG